MKSDLLKQILDEMAQQPWHVRFRRWCRMQYYVALCLTRKWWDKSYPHYVFKKKNNDK